MAKMDSSSVTWSVRVIAGRMKRRSVRCSIPAAAPLPLASLTEFERTPSLFLNLS
jgi:hypothetical protein